MNGFFFLNFKYLQFCNLVPKSPSSHFPHICNLKAGGKAHRFLNHEASRIYKLQHQQGSMQQGSWCGCAIVMLQGLFFIKPEPGFQVNIKDSPVNNQSSIQQTYGTHWQQEANTIIKCFFLLSISSIAENRVNPLQPQFLFKHVDKIIHFRVHLFVSLLAFHRSLLLFIPLALP